MDMFCYVGILLLIYHKKIEKCCSFFQQNESILRVFKMDVHFRSETDTHVLNIAAFSPQISPKKTLQKKNKGELKHTTSAGASL